MKVLSKMRNNPRDWQIEDLKALASHYRIDYRQHGASHVTFRHANAGLLTVPAARPIKPIYIHRFLTMVDSLENLI